MPPPMRQSIKMAGYLASQKLRRREKFPLLVELEPLFQCNLECAGCGKIQHPEHVLRRRMPVEQAVGAIEESGAPMVSIAGGLILGAVGILVVVEWAQRRLRRGRTIVGGIAQLSSPM